MAGAVLPLGFAPFGWFWLTPLSLAALFVSWLDCLPSTAAKRGFVFGFAGFTAGTYWLYISIHIFGQAPLWVAVPLMLGLVVIMGGYLAACGWFAARVQAGRMLTWLLVWPAAWVLVEWLRGWLFTGFPWLSLGYGQIDGPLRGWAPVSGVYGLGMVTAILAGALVCCWRGALRERLVAVSVIAVIGVGSWLLDGREWTTPSGDALQVALVQGSISQDRKWLPEQRRPTMELYRDLTFSGPAADLVVWPEVAIPAMAHTVTDFLSELQYAAEEIGLQLLLGILVYEVDTEQFYNSLIALGTETGIYNKRHLVPFGEFFPVPSFIREWMRLMSLPYRDTAAGERRQEPLRANGILLAPSICYEDAFGSETLDFLPDAGLLVNVSNDAWFGDSLAPHQHLQIARMRALETGRYMLRTTNTGITAIIGPDGGIRAESPQFETHVLRGSVRAYTGATPYVRTGNWPVLLFAGLLVLVGWWRRPARH